MNVYSGKKAAELKINVKVNQGVWVIDIHSSNKPQHSQGLNQFSFFSPPLGKMEWIGVGLDVLCKN